MQSPDLTKFYQDYLDWVDNGAIDGGRYTTRWGLCSNLSRWCDEMDANFDKLMDEMLDQFSKARLNHNYPFDTQYTYYENQGKHHLNEARMKWVREHAGL